MVVILLVFLTFALAGFAAWNTTMCLRIGVITTRMGVQISRSENPFLFWFGISLGGIASIMALYIGVWIVGQWWIHG